MKWRPATDSHPHNCVLLLRWVRSHNQDDEPIYHYEVCERRSTMLVDQLNTVLDFSLDQGGRGDGKWEWSVVS